MLVIEACQSQFERIVQSEIQSASKVHCETCLIPVSCVEIVFGDILLLILVRHTCSFGLQGRVSVLLGDLGPSDQQLQMRNPPFCPLWSPARTSDISENVAAPMRSPLKQSASPHIQDGLPLGGQPESRSPPTAVTGPGVSVSQVLACRYVEREVKG